MSNEPQLHHSEGWLDATGLPHIARTLGVAVQPGKLIIALVAIFLTFILGGILDWAWTVPGGGVTEDAIARCIRASELDQPYVEADGDHGIFEVWREHERRSVLGLLGSSLPGASVAAGTPVGNYVELHSQANPLRNLAGIGYGVWWLFRYHSVYFLFFGLGSLLIWSCAGGAICRMSAIQFARDEKLTVKQAIQFSVDKLFGGFFLAPCIPLAFILITAILLTIGGALLRVPVIGDLLAGLCFFLAILGGFVVAILCIGLLVGGNLFWPSVATEGSDAFDAFSRSLSYALSRPWKVILYVAITTIYAAICWVFVNLFTFLALTITRGIVSFGTSWWNRGSEGEPITKLELLWPLAGPNAMYSWPDWSKLGTFEYFSAFVIGVYVLIVIGLMWAFLASFYFSGSTIIYHLLRRDVDGTDLDDVYIEEEEEAEALGAVPSAVGAASASVVSLPVTGQSDVAPPASTEPKDNTPDDEG